ncbi:MAG: hypothetical protein DME19_11720 [Verrucomicrobia bacterium]|nr:MAG: hypothetical protein DME19_11720 [Verrucomicrobiota bacterium]
MRVTFLTHYPGRGGSTFVTAQLAGFFRDCGHQTQIVVADDSEDAIVDDYIVVRRRSGEGWRGRMIEYKRTIDQTRPDVVYSISGIEELNVLRFLSMPRVRHFSSLERNEYVDIPYLLPQVTQFLESITANTPDVLAHVRAGGGDRFAGWVAPYRIAPAFLDAPSLSETTTNRGGLKVCFIARLERVLKRAHWIPEIVARCKQAGQRFRWHIFGEGPMEPWMRKTLESQRNVGDVSFHGWVDSQTLARELPAYDVFFLCSRSEGLPIAMVEAMLCGLACVVPAIPAGITHVLEKGGGWLYPAASPAAAANALIEAARDPTLLQRKKREAQGIARGMFATRAVEEQLKRLEAGVKKLTFNGNRLSIENAADMRAVPLGALLRRKLISSLGAMRPHRQIC